MLSPPAFKETTTITTPATTTQVAPTILMVLGMEPSRLLAVRKEGTKVLPGLDFSQRHESHGHER